MAEAVNAANRSGPIKVRDGLSLHLTHWPAAEPASAPPVLCLPGLTRNGRDFADVAAALSSGTGARDVFALDARGRGLSDHDPNWRNYSIPTEAQDVIDVMAALDLHDAAILGTSRGGLVAMVLAAVQPSLIGSVVLNDIGPVIEREGLLRIAGYVGRMPLPNSWEDAARMVADVSRKAFPAVPDATWRRVARAWFNEKDGRPVPGYDANLGRSFSATDAAPPTLWPQFGALKHASVLVIRGETSDLLSTDTVRQMQTRHPRCTSHVVKGEGHAPLLMDQPTIDVVRAFFAQSAQRRRIVSKAS
jgi:pimeloyl-ACP methyl ester carboxylesterase